MDRDLPAAVTRRLTARRWASLLVPLAVVAAGLLWLPAWLRPTVSLARVRTATVVAGPLDASVTASGLVVPAIERVVSSPLDARVLRILQRPGAALKPGDAVIELDVSEAMVALERAETTLAVKDNEQRQTRLGYDRSLVDLDGRIRIKTLDLESRRADLAMHRLLASQGLLSREELRRTELGVQQTEVELAQLTDERAHARASTDVKLEGLALQRRSLDQDVREQRRVLDLATTKSDRTGVLTWVVSEAGALVRRGDVLARIADLSAYRVDATVSDVHAERVRVGLPARVRLDNDTVIDGRVSEVFPTIENGGLRFTVSLDDASHAGLRPSQRAEVQVVTERRARTLKVARGPFADGTGARQVFVVEGHRAVRRQVELGAASLEEIEVLAGLREGDTVIASDMRDYLHLTTFTLR